MQDIDQCIDIAFLACCDCFPEMVERAIEEALESQTESDGADDLNLLRGITGMGKVLE